MNKRIKVLHILWAGGIGGTEEYLTSLIQYMNFLEYEIHLCFLSRKGPLFDEAVRIHQHVTFIGMKNGFDLLSSLKLLMYLYREKFDIIHMHSACILPNFVISLLSTPKKVFTEHVSPGATILFKNRKVFYTLFTNSFQTIISVSEFLKQKLIEVIKVNPKKMIVVHNGININKYNQSITPPHDLLDIVLENTFVIGFIGRMENFKRPDLFVTIASEIIKKRNDVFFIMVGDGSELEKSKQLVSHYGIDNYFKFLGFRRDIPNILKLFDALFFLSSGEAFGIVILEAMAMGVPVFAILEGAVSEIISHKENGILFDTTNPSLIAQHILEVLGEIDLIKKMKEQCKKDVQLKFSIESNARKIEEVYKKILHTHT